MKETVIPGRIARLEVKIPPGKNCRNCKAQINVDEIGDIYPSTYCAVYQCQLTGHYYKSKKCDYWEPTYKKTNHKCEDCLNGKLGPNEIEKKEGKEE